MRFIPGTIIASWKLIHRNAGFQPPHCRTQEPRKPRLL